MADAKKYLPPTLTDWTPIYTLLASVQLPKPRGIKLLSASGGAFHTIYVLTYAPETLSEILSNVPCTAVISPTNLILRVSGRHYAAIKTQNEWAVLRWVAQNTTIPVPAVVRYDVTENNALGCEYILMTQGIGTTMDHLYPQLRDSVAFDRFCDQLLDVVQALHQRTWDKIGGLTDAVQGSAEIIPGPIVNETMWQTPELEQFWDGKETHESLNISGPFDTYVDMLDALAEKHVYCIETHPSMAPMRDVIPQLEAYRAALRKHAGEINNVRIVLAHRDLHFGNILYDVDTQKITSIIDWEFSALVPIVRWDPSRCFMWIGKDGPDDMKETYRLRDVIMQRAKDKGLDVFTDTAYRNTRQEHAQDVERFLNAICQVLPRGQSDRPWQSWREAMLTALDQFLA